MQTFAVILFFLAAVSVIGGGVAYLAIKHKQRRAEKDPAKKKTKTGTYICAIIAFAVIGLSVFRLIRGAPEPKAEPAETTRATAATTRTPKTTRTTTTTTTITTAKTTVETAETTKYIATYILNTSTKVIHDPGCRTIKNSKNLKETTDYDGAISQGYGPCGVCHPRKY